MSELKVYVHPLKTNIFGRTILGQSYYDKSEADKVIAEKDKEIAELIKACNAKDEWCLHTLKENRHHKRKRCLAMANYWGLLVACTHREIQLKCMRRELKWQKLAEKFKEAK